MALGKGERHHGGDGGGVDAQRVDVEGRLPDPRTQPGEQRVDVEDAAGVPRIGKVLRGDELQRMAHALGAGARAEAQPLGIGVAHEAIGGKRIEQLAVVERLPGAERLWLRHARKGSLKHVAPC